MKSLSQNIGDKIQSTVQRFFDGTSLHGFYDLGSAKTKFWRFIWWLVVLAALILTVYQMYYATVQFMEQSSVTSIQAPRSGVLYPTLGMCFTHWLYWIDWESAFALNFTKESILYGMSFLTNVFNNETFDIDNAKQHFIKTLAQNNFTTLTQFYKRVAKNFPQILGSFPVYPVLQTDPTVLKTKNIYYKGDEYFMCYTMSSQEIEEVFKEAAENTKDAFSR